MKKLTILIIIASLTGLSSCKKVRELLGGSSLNKDTVEQIISHNEKLQKKLREDSLMHVQELNMLREQYENEIEKLKATAKPQRKVSGYFVVVGSFKNPAYANEYSSKIRAMGYEGALVDGPNNFTLVTSGTYTNLKDAVEGQTVARNKLASTAWVYLKR